MMDAPAQRGHRQVERAGGQRRSCPPSSAYTADVPGLGCPNMDAPSGELRWLACREKSCCHDSMVVIGGPDLLRIATMLGGGPWDFTPPTPAPAGAAGALPLGAGGGPPPHR